VDKIEAIRAHAKQGRQGDTLRQRELIEYLRELPERDLLPVTRAFNQFLNLANIAEQHGLAVAHFDNIKQQFNALLAKPDKRIQIVTDFQQVGARKVQG
jgi:phosphoenolpyruvate carboxylase